MIPFQNKNEQWSLFLDRDGVLNEEIHNNYVNDWSEFVFYPDTLSAMRSLSTIFKPIIVVTNQRGVGKGITKMESLNLIHENMIQQIESHGGRIDQIYFCPDTETNSPNRKPNTGMGLQAKQEHPEIEFKRSIMVGNNLSDMEFGKKLGMYTVFITSTHPELNQSHPDIDLSFPNLSLFADWALSKLC